MSVPERGGRCLSAPSSPDPVVKAEREAAWHGRQKAESGRGRGAGGQPAGSPQSPAAAPLPRRPAPAERGRPGTKWRGLRWGARARQ